MPSPINLELWLARFGTPPNIDSWHAIPICGYDDSTAPAFFVGHHDIGGRDDWEEAISGNNVAKKHALQFTGVFSTEILPKIFSRNT
jgi:hypothetical protein